MHIRKYFNNFQGFGGLCYKAFANKPRNSVIFLAFKSVLTSSIQLKMITKLLNQDMQNIFTHEISFFTILSWGYYNQEQTPDQTFSKKYFSRESAPQPMCQVVHLKFSNKTYPRFTTFISKQLHIGNFTNCVENIITNIHKCK